MSNIRQLARVGFDTVAPTNSILLDLITTFELNGHEIDITGIAFRAMVRPTIDSPVVCLDAQTSDWTSSDVTSGNGWLVSDGLSGTLAWNVPQSWLATMPLQTLAVDIVAKADGIVVEVGSYDSTFTPVLAPTRWSPQT